MGGVGVEENMGIFEGGGGGERYFFPGKSELG